MEQRKHLSLIRETVPTRETLRFGAVPCFLRSSLCWA